MTSQRTIGELDEIVLNILRSLDAGEVIKCSLVCKRWNRVANDNSLWHGLVLNRWPSQRAVLGQVSTMTLQWQKLYRYLQGIGNYSPDDMKYFITCKLVETILDSEELRQAVFRVMEDVTSRWEKPRLFELEETSPRFFNSNMELYYDTHDLKWVFVDRRREYVDDSFTIRLNQDRMTSRQMRFIRPYQVMASCIMMYRWLILFRYMFTEDVGLAFYRIWRFRLKHSDTSFIFETYDWKAAMSSTFSHGCPVSTKFRDDGLAVLDMLSSPFFVTHPLGNTYKIHYEIAFPVYSESVFSSENVSRSSSIETLDSIKSEPKIADVSFTPKANELSTTPKAEEFLIRLKPSELSAGLTAPKAGALSVLQKTGELSGAAVVASKGITHSFSSDTLSSYSGKSANEDDQESEDNGDDSGYFCNCEYFIHRSSWEYEEQQLVQAEVATRWETIIDHPQPTFELVFDSYEEKWLFCRYNPTNLKRPAKLNRQLVEKSLELAKPIREDDAVVNEAVSASMNNMEIDDSTSTNETENLTDLATTSTCVLTKDTSVPECAAKAVASMPGTSSDTEQTNYSLGQEAMPSSLTLYRLVCLFDLASPQYKSSEECCVWSVCLQHRLTRGMIQFQDLNGWLRVFATLNREQRLYCSDLAVMSLNQNIGFLDDSKSLGSNSKVKPEQHSSTSSDNQSEVSSDGSSEEEYGNPLERFTKDTCALLQLLVNQKFAHPYGTVAGAVA
ncbi:uncharacterized protein LOC114518080 [Dendronephthya gigantea]|uniref:uncharacterized protein LOC114518080 n=1 Tax=Dendronephthya gigantea TaxID=151771 RepID=UPI00106B3D5D|nr:uncharacterized protein LOC114518080 [Dendronephthya gigantea]